MSPDNPFLKALLAEPDDDTLRLVMADWFDENDQPARAELIRVQIELAQNRSSPERLRQLKIRQRDLLIAHDTQWVQPLAAVLGCRKGKWGGWVGVSSRVRRILSRASNCHHPSRREVGSTYSSA